MKSKTKLVDECKMLIGFVGDKLKELKAQGVTVTFGLNAATFELATFNATQEVQDDPGPLPLPQGQAPIGKWEH